MVKLLLQTSGWLLAHLPEAVLRPLTWLLGRLVWWVFASRRRLVLSNLHHAFPEKSAGWRAALGRECLRRVVETALLSLAMPFLPEGRLRAMVRGDNALLDLFARHRADPHPVVACAPHVAHWETGTLIPLLAGAPFPEFGIIFRPLDNPAADAFVKRTRERFGMRLLSRREGFLEANRILERKGFVAVLFDQNSGQRGALTTLFGRVCSTTSMPGALAEKNQAEVVTIFMRHTGFWRIEISSTPVAHDGTVEGITSSLNQWLENLLRSDAGMCTSWLWGHKRWKNQDAPAVRLRLEQKLNFLESDLRRRALPSLPRRTRLWIRLPNWLGDVVMALPLLRAVRASRPDAEITLIAKPQFLPLLAQLQVADRLRALPPKGGWSYYAHFHGLRGEFPDCYLLFTNSLRGDLEAWLTGCPQRFGIARRGRRRPLLTHRHVPSADFDEGTRHQFELWTKFLQHFGLQAAPDRTPFRIPTPDPQLSASSPIGLICGSENNPEKRWPVAHWRRLIELRPDHHFILFGTTSDRAITEAIAAGYGNRVTDLAGQTDLPRFAKKLAGCRLLIANDTGGMHLANALGVPVIGLFGPTNPVRTGPIFTAPVSVLQPPGCPPTGGGALADLRPETVAAALVSQLPALRA
jgi:ADP-heptose:LPS heptosyltransferase/lauroyl/myristoyl acyltransferase